MLYTILSALTRKLSGHLRLVYHLTDDVVTLNNPGGKTNNKLNISLVNIEREAAGGHPFNYKSDDAATVKKTLPSWPLNLYVLIAAVTVDKQYEEGLQMLSAALLYLQSNNTFTAGEPENTYTIEPVNLGLSGLTHLWSLCGNRYHPSILCKIRMWMVDSGEIQSMPLIIDSPHLNTESI